MKLAYTLVHVTGLFITVGCCAGLRLLQGLCDSLVVAQEDSHHIANNVDFYEKASEEDVVTRSVVKEKRSDAK